MREYDLSVFAYGKSTSPFRRGKGGHLSFAGSTYPILPTFPAIPNSAFRIKKGLLSQSFLKSVFLTYKPVNRHSENLGNCNKLIVAYASYLTFEL